MIPRRLTLRNFLSYKATTELDFAGIHVACLSGDNGHGKSALLDAITWALWGKARVTSDDELVHIGEVEMEVELEFALDGANYRALRKRKRGTTRGGGHTSLELQSEAPEGWRSLSGNTIRATQQRIIGLLRLDYDTFINSAFLLQGRADEFSTRTPAERKGVLGEILGLRAYDALVDQAKLEARQREASRIELQAELDIIDRQTAELPRLRIEAEETRVALREADGELRRAAAALEAARESHRLADLRARQTNDALTRVREADAALAALRTQIATHEQAIARSSSVIARAGDIERGYAALEAARREAADYGGRAGEAMTLQQRRHTLEAAIESARHDAGQAVAAAAQRVAELDARASRLAALTDERATALQLRAEADELAVELKARRDEARAAGDEALALETTNAALRAAMLDLRRKLDELAAADAACPLCARPLGAEEKARIEALYESEGKSDAAAVRGNRERLDVLRADAAALAAAADKIEADRAHREREAIARITQLDRDLADAQAAAGALDPARERHRILAATLAAAEYATEARAELATVARAIAALDFDVARHETLRAAVDDLAPFEAEHAALAEARVRQQSEGEALARAQADLGGWSARRARDCAELEGLRAAAGAASDIAGELARAEAEHGRTTKRAGDMRQALGAIEGSVEACARLLENRPAKAEHLRTVADEQQLYLELSSAFGRQGVQALLIDEALPELTDEANRLLHQMTAGRMSLMMTTQRATQKGDLRETLDIHIADELGTRPYETYSGGEAFRIDFALRIALSKLLARRAGARLPILVIDEGFGTQDSSGRERLVEAITTVQDDFEMLLAVTHIDELRDVFPHRIHVTKTSEGSAVEVL